MKDTVLAEILDWSITLPGWQRDALRRVFVNGSTTDADVRDLTELCKSAHGLSPAREADPVLEAHMPIAGAAAGPVTLSAVTHVAGVNALAPDQTIKFGPQLTAVYGDNGAGKSGYFRILKAACRARAAEQILGNVVSGEAPLKAKATIRFQVGGVDAQHSWEPGARDSALSAISVFDSLCAPIYLRDKTDVAFRPFSLDVFDRLSTTCNGVRSALDFEQRQLASLPTAAVTLPEGTKARSLVDGLTALTSVDEVRSLATLSALDQDRLKTLRALELDARATDPKQRSRELTQRASRVTALADHVQTIYATFESTRITDVPRLSGLVSAARQAVTELRASALGGDLVAGTGEAAWKAMWDAAVTFVATTGGSPIFPTLAPGSRCPLCQEVLPDDARDRIRHFAEFVSSNVQALLTALEVELEQALSALKMAVGRKDTDLVIEEMASDEGDLADEVKAAMSMAVQVQLALSVSSRRSVDLRLPASPEDRLRRLVEGYRERARQLVTEGSLMSGAQAAELKELDAREKLGSQLLPVLDIIERKKRLAVYTQCIGETSTTAITKKSTALTKQLVTEKLREAFQQELVSLEFTDLSVEIRAAGGAKGAFYHQILFTNAPGVTVTTVLSEGESRTLSLAAFLTELSTAPAKSTIIFDDPVSSLDHIWRSRIARRLVKEAKARQVIVFTHDLLFLRLLVDGANDRGIECTNQYLLRVNENSAGVSSADLPWIAMNIKQRIGWLNSHWQTADKLYRKADVDGYQRDAAYILGRLREAWEQGVSEVLLNGVVERFRQSIETRRVDSLHDITLADCQDVETGMAYCSRWMVGHAAAAADATPFPQPPEVKQGIDALAAWVERIRKRRQ
jgi:hypothetical protein